MLLFSIHPRFVDAILNGTKKVELRRRKPRMQYGPALIYATSPRMELVAQFQIIRTEKLPLSQLWAAVHEDAGVSKDEFDAYFKGLEYGVGIWISKAIRLAKPLSLEKLRAIWDGFHPPQGFCFSKIPSSYLSPTTIFA